MQHGAGGKWYLNAENYSSEIAEKYDLREFLFEQYLNFEQMSVRKVKGFDPVGMDHTYRHDKALSHFGYEPIVSPEEAFARTVTDLKMQA